MRYIFWTDNSRVWGEVAVEICFCGSKNTASKWSQWGPFWPPKFGDSFGDPFPETGADNKGVTFLMILSHGCRKGEHPIFWIRAHKLPSSAAFALTFPSLRESRDRVCSFVGSFWGSPDYDFVLDPGSRP